MTWHFDYRPSARDAKSEIKHAAIEIQTHQDSTHALTSTSQLMAGMVDLVSNH